MDKENFLESETYKNYQQKLEEKKKTIIDADNAIHLSYLSPMISDEDICEYKKLVKNIDLQLSYYDKSGVMYNCLDQYSLVTFLVVAQPLIGSILTNVSSNAIWEVVKSILLSIWNKNKDRKYKKLSGGKIEDKELSFGLKVVLDKNTCLDFELKGDFDEKIIDKSLNKVLNFLKDKKLNQEYKNTNYVYYDDIHDKWIEIDVEEEIRKSILERKNTDKLI